MVLPEGDEADNAGDNIVDDFAAGDIVEYYDDGDHVMIADIVEDDIENNLFPFQQSFHNFTMSLICSDPEDKVSNNVQ